MGTEVQLQRASLSRTAPGNNHADTPAQHVSKEAADLELGCLTVHTVTSSANSGQSHETKEESSCVYSLERTYRENSCP